MITVDEQLQLPFGQPTVLELPPMYRTLQAAGRIVQARTPVGDPAWLVTRHDQARRLFMDDRLCRSHPDPDNAPRPWDAGFIGKPLEAETSKDEHAYVRRVLNGSFSAGRLRALRPRVQALVDHLIDDLTAAGPPADLQAGLARPLPVLVICELLGVPYDDRDDFIAWSNEAANTADGEAAMAALTRLGMYMYGLMQRKRAESADDVLADLVRARDDGPLNEIQAVRWAVALLFAGHETTASMLGHGVLLLLTHAEQRAGLERDPARIDDAVEEILRAAVPSPLGWVPRWASGDIEIDGTTIRAGDLVLIAILATNADPAVFQTPDAFDTGRGANPHLAFGHGSHFCVGASLARLELQVAIGTLFHRLPKLRLGVPVAELRIRTDSITGGLQALPVIW
jgi:pentalenolactone synthase